MLLWGWDTRTRTRKGRTRICSVTITPYPNMCCNLFPYCECKGTNYFYNNNVFRKFFLIKSNKKPFSVVLSRFLDKSLYLCTA